MPGGDRTGPNGLGPMTGRAAGYCAGFGAAGYMTSYRPGLWRGGRGRGRRRYATGFAGWLPAIGRLWPAGFVGASFLPGTAQQQEIDSLKGQVQYIEEVLDGLRRRVDEMVANRSAV